MEISIKNLFESNGLDIDMTCGACPEQYEVFKEGKQVAYFRLRHGRFRVEYPNCGGEMIYEAYPLGDGIFEVEEREKYMTEAMNALLNKLAA